MTQLQSNDDLNRVISWYLSVGYTLFPLIGKVPPKGIKWSRSQFNPFAELTDFPSGNFGVKLKEDDVIVDVDPRNFKYGVDSLALFCKQIGILIPTFRVITGGGGFHFYYKKPSDVEIRGSLKEYPGIEFKTKGQYVVGLGSLHPESGKAYIGNTAPVVGLPKYILDAIERKSTPLATQGLAAYSDDQQNVERYIEYLTHAPIAIEGEGGDKTTFVVAATGRDFGLSPQKTTDLMLLHYNEHCDPPWEPVELEKKVANAYRYSGSAVGNKTAQAVAFPIPEESVPEVLQKHLQRNGHGQPLRNLHNVAAFFAPKCPLAGLIGLNEFSHMIVFLKKAPWHEYHIKGQIWNDEDAMNCRHWLSTTYKIEPQQNMMMDAAVVAARHYKFHPLREYLESLQWDGHKRVHNWMHQFLGAPDNEYTRAVGMKTLVAAVKRVYEPGCKFDYIPVLEGRQDTGKSTAWKILASEEFFSDSAIDVTKEWSIIKTFGKWFNEWAEMETQRKAEAQAIKAFLSSSIDTVRLPYARVPQSIKRQGIFVGTINPEKDEDIGWLKDTTGNRRYWIVSTSVTHDIRTNDLKKVRDQLWAEAFALYHMETPIYFEDKEVLRLAMFEQARRLGQDPWYHAIESWLGKDFNSKRMIIRGDEIFQECIGGALSNYRRAEMLRVSLIMASLRWDKGIFYNNDTRAMMRGYKRPEKEMEIEIE